jgi:hypothetical protein
VAKELSIDEVVVKAAQCHTDLNIFAAIVSILEGGVIYTPYARRTSAKIISICQKEQQRLLQNYDAARRLLEATRD